MRSEELRLTEEEMESFSSKGQVPKRILDIFNGVNIQSPSRSDFEKSLKEGKI